MLDDVLACITEIDRGASVLTVKHVASTSGRQTSTIYGSLEGHVDADRVEIA